jgi:pantoate--beta-alanine ligase
MHTVQTIADVRRLVESVRRAGRSVSFVPTMGNLHPGHMRLVEEAAAYADFVVVSIFVNPMQFAAGEDLDRYPRTLEGDRAVLEGAGVDLLFVPETSEMYSRGHARSTFVEVPALSEILCGALRPGHFRGVATVVCKLFHIVQPDLAVFGAKDFQQLLVIRKMVEDLALPVDVLGVETVRESDGLAISSRNGYLTREQRRIAPLLYQTLRLAAEHISQGDRDFEGLGRRSFERLRDAGFRPDYFSVHRASDLKAASTMDDDLVLLASAWLGEARLIDNVRIGAR